MSKTPNLRLKKIKNRQTSRFPAAFYPLCIPFMNGFTQKRSFFIFQIDNRQPGYCKINLLTFGGIAQLARVLDWQSRGRGFESHYLHQKKKFCTQYRAFSFD